MTSRADDIEPDSKDWTWVLAKPCPDCGFDASAVQPAQVPNLLRRDAADWVERLRGDRVRVRPLPTVWSTLEYGCHVRDVHRIFETRVRMMLTQDEPHFPNWDQDETARTDDYASQDPAVVADQLFSAATAVAETYDVVRGQDWQRRGLRSNGSEFTVATIALYHLHDIAHHAFDVGPGRPRVPASCTR